VTTEKITKRFESINKADVDKFIELDAEVEYDDELTHE
jgi:hypothetical protein